MIDGFKFDITSKEVAEKIDGLIKYREGRLAIIAKEIARAKTRPVSDFEEQIDKHLQEDHGQEPYSSTPKPDAERFRDSVVHGLSLAERGHRTMIERLRFMKEHLVKDETFRVSWMELGLLFPESRDHAHFPACFGHDHDDDDEDGLHYFGVPSLGDDKKSRKKRDGD